MKNICLMLTMCVQLLLFIGLYIDASTATFFEAVLRNTILVTINDAYTVNSACECKQRCSVQEACLAASYKSPSTCWMFKGGAGGEQSGGLWLRHDDEFITWLKNEVTTESTSTITTVATTSTDSPVTLFFISSLPVNNLSLETLKSACARQSGVPGSIFTAQEYAWIKENLDLSSPYVILVVPAFAEKDSYFWYDGPEVVSTGVFQEGVNFYESASGPGPYVIMDSAYNLVKTNITASYYYALCKET